MPGQLNTDIVKLIKHQHVVWKNIFTIIPRTLLEFDDSAVSLFVGKSVALVPVVDKTINGRSSLLVNAIPAQTEWLFLQASTNSYLSFYVWVVKLTSVYRMCPRGSVDNLSLSLCTTLGYLSFAHRMATWS